MKLVAQTFSPPATLRPYVDHYWFHTYPSATRALSAWQQCLPTGKVELIFHLDSGRLHGMHGPEYVTFPEAYVVGLHSEPVRWQIPGQSTIFGVQLTLEGFMRIFRRPLAAIVESYADVRGFLGAEGRHLLELVQGAASHSQRIAALDRFFRERISEPRPGERYLLEALRTLHAAEGQHSIEALSESVFIGKRQLQRTFRDYFGTTPKAYSRIIRFRTAYDYLAEHPKTNWAAVCYEFGYADQSHFIRDFKQFTGTAPTAFLSNYVPSQASSFALSAA